MRYLDSGAVRLFEWLAVAGTLCHVLRDLASNTLDFQASRFLCPPGWRWCRNRSLLDNFHLLPQCFHLPQHRFLLLTLGRQLPRDALTPMGVVIGGCPARPSSASMCAQCCGSAHSATNRRLSASQIGSHASPAGLRRRMESAGLN
jgi:hypothetical protein